MCDNRVTKRARGEESGTDGSELEQDSSDSGDDEGEVIDGSRGSPDDNYMSADEEPPIKPRAAPIGTDLKPPRVGVQTSEQGGEKKKKKKKREGVSRGMSDRGHRLAMDTVAVRRASAAVFNVLDRMAIGAGVNTIAAAMCDMRQDKHTTFRLSNLMAAIHEGGNRPI